MFEELNEYTIVLSGLILQHTQLEIWCQDERIFWFTGKNPRIHIVDAFPENRFDKTTLYIQTDSRSGLEDFNFSRMSSQYAFHNVFFLQWILDGRALSDFRFFTIPISSNGGIGALLSAYKRDQSAASQFGLTYVAPDRDYFGKYPRSMVEKYFALDIWNPAANETNTLVVPNLVILFKTKFYATMPATLETSAIAESFRHEMDEYYEAVLGGKKTLGVLIRGSDYISAGMKGIRKMATVEQMIPRIHKWMTDYGYEKIFLATEDSDVLARMKKEFGRNMIALSQERISVRELRKGQIISEYEKEHNTEDYAVQLEDTTINYFYALYLLSKCNAFLCSGQCNGWDNVITLNAGKFERSYRFTVGVTGDPMTEDWKEICPVTSGMFTRSVYPSDKAFFMTFRFDLTEQADPDAIRQAWEKTLTVYPYMRYAVVGRADRLILTENPLPFVIMESGETIEPFERSGNFHSVTFCYQGRTLWIYADHVPVDGTGMRYVFETFFYHYYCIVDKTEYPVPAGVFTEKDGPVPGQDVDAFLTVEPIDIGSAMKGYKADKIFEPPEMICKNAFPNPSDCRAYCLTVPSSEMMTYARSVGGSPTSVLSVALSKAVQRVHPENTLPVKILYPVSTRKALHNERSLLPQGVFAQYTFVTSDLASKSDIELNAACRAYFKEFTSEANMRLQAGIFHSRNERFTRAYAHGSLDALSTEMRRNAGAAMEISYLGTLRTGDYGSRIHLTVFRVMPENGVMLQVTEVGGTFYIDWSQGIPDAVYIRALRDVLSDMGMKGLCLERME